MVNDGLPIRTIPAVHCVYGGGGDKNMSTLYTETYMYKLHAASLIMNLSGANDVTLHTPHTHNLHSTHLQPFLRART